MAKINPFNPNSVVMPNLFAGRTVQVMNICTKLSRLKDGISASFFVYGERGIGKTALAKLILHISKLKDPKLHNLNILTSYYCVEKSQDVGSVLQESINRLTDGIERNILVQIGERVGGLFKNGKFQIGAFGLEAQVDISANEQKNLITIKDQSVSILSNILKSFRNSENSGRDGILIVIDEIHNLEKVQSFASILRNIITTLDVDELGKVSFLLIGYEEDLERFFQEDSSSRRAFDLILLGVMSPEEAGQVLIKGFKSALLKYDKQSLDRNINSAGGYPHSIQILGHNLIRINKDDTIGDDDWDDALFKTALELRSKDFIKMYSFGKNLKVRDEILILLATENKPLSRKEINNKLKPSIYQHIELLKKSGAIKENNNSELVLHSQLFRTSIIIDQILREKEIQKQLEL